MKENKLKRFIIIFLFGTISSTVFAQTHSKLELSFNNYPFSDGTVGNHGLSFAFGMNSPIRNKSDLQISLKTRVHSHWHSNTPGGENLVVDLILPIKLVYKLYQRVGVSGGISFGYDELISIGNSFGNEISRSFTENLNIGYNGYFVFEYSKQISTLIGFSHTFSGHKTLPSLDLGVLFVFK